MSHFEYRLNRRFWQVFVQVVQIGEGGGGNLDKIRKNSSSFSWYRPLPLINFPSHNASKSRFKSNKSLQNRKMMKYEAINILNWTELYWTEHRRVNNANWWLTTETHKKGYSGEWWNFRVHDSLRHNGKLKEAERINWGLSSLYRDLQQCVFDAKRYASAAWQSVQSSCRYCEVTCFLSSLDCSDHASWW